MMPEQPPRWGSNQVRFAPKAVVSTTWSASRKRTAHSDAEPTEMGGFATVRSTTVRPKSRTFVWWLERAGGGLAGLGQTVGGRRTFVVAGAAAASAQRFGIARVALYGQRSGFCT